jgi:hypothetical protein
MPNTDHLERVRQGVGAWNAWRAKEPSVRANLSGADLRDSDLKYADLRGADLRGADLRGANLDGANLDGANLSGANLNEASLNGADLHNGDLSWTNLSGAILFGTNLYVTDLSWANLSGAKLNGANLSGAKLNEADLRGANLSGADLSRAQLVDVDLAKADLTGCRIHGISAWGLKLDTGTKHQDLVITKPDEPEVTVDDLEVAQFIYLLLHNEKIRNVIDTITSKAVLILGRFTSERKQVLDALRNELRKRNYLPIVFDFEKPATQTRDETITLLARMARFVIADISDAKSVLQELRGIVPDLPSVAVQPIILVPQEEPGMFDFFRKYPWVLNAHRYDNQQQLITDLEEQVIRRAEAKVLELRGPLPG